jgi:hypothetical protein
VCETDFSEVGDRATVACSFVKTDADSKVPHLRWELEQVMTRVRPQDLSAVEIAALLTILIPAHSRVIGRPTLRPGLRVVEVGGEHLAPKLA